MRFITDYGAPIVLLDEQGGQTLIPRYGVWAGRWKPQVIAVGDDLAVLQAWYGPDLPVYSIKSGVD